METPKFEDSMSIDDNIPNFQDSSLPPNTELPKFEDSEALPSYANGLSPHSPLNKSPVSLIDQVLLSFGNEAGRLKFLKSKYENVVKSKDGDLVVEDRGIWYRVNTTNLGEPDAWEATKKILSFKGDANVTRETLKKLSGMAGIGIDIAGMEVGRKAGAATGGYVGLGVGGPAGMIAGATAGYFGGAIAGAGAGEGIRTSLGRLARTYEATPEEQVKDIGWEGLLIAGGEAVALGIKPTLPMLKNALTNASEWTTNFGKELMSSVWGNTTGAGKWSVRRAMDSAASVIGKTDVAVRNAVGLTAPREEAVKYAAKKQVGLARTLADGTNAALKANYRNSFKEIVQDTPDSFTADVRGMMQNVQKKLEQNGVGAFYDKKTGQRITNYTDNAVTKTSPVFGESEISMMGGPKKSVTVRKPYPNADDLAYGYDIGAKDVEFRIFKPDEVAQIINSGTDVPVPRVVTDAAYNQLKTLERLTNQYSKFQPLKGKAGAGTLLEMKRAVGQSIDGLFTPETSGAVQQAASGLRKSFNTDIAKNFAAHDARLGQKFLDMDAAYTAKVDAVKEFNHLAAKNPDVLVQKLVNKSGRYGTLQDDAKLIADLMGDAGHKTLNDILDWEASKGFVNYIPKMTGGNSLDSGIQKLITLGTAGTQTNARVVGKQIQYGTQLLDFLKSLPPKQLKEFLGNDEYLMRAITPILQAYDGEDKVVQQLLQSTGVIPNGSQR